MPKDLLFFKLSGFGEYVFSMRRSEKLPDTHPFQRKSDRQEYFSLGYKPLIAKCIVTGIKSTILHFDERYNFVQIAQDNVVVGNEFVIKKPPVEYDVVIEYLMGRYDKYKASDPEFNSKNQHGGSKYTGYIYQHEFMEYVVNQERREKLLKLK